MVDVAPVVPHTPGQWRLLYFDAPNRGEQVRILFHLTNVPFDDVRLDYPKGLDPYKKAAMGDESPLLGTDLCPAVTAPDGSHCIETSDIMRFVGQRVGMAPEAGSAADEKAMALTLLAQTVMNKVFYPLLKPMIVRQIFGTEFWGAIYWARWFMIGKEQDYLPAPMKELNESLDKFEAALAESGGPYICGEKMTYADASIFAITNEVLAFCCFDKSKLLATRPKFAAYFAALEEKTAGWIDQRVKEHQLGIRSTVALFAAVHTPFPWSKVKKKKP